MEKESTISRYFNGNGHKKASYDSGSVWFYVTSEAQHKEFLEVGIELHSFVGHSLYSLLDGKQEEIEDSTRINIEKFLADESRYMATCDIFVGKIMKGETLEKIIITFRDVNETV
jgi:hypothetical protein